MNSYCELHVLLKHIPWIAVKSGHQPSRLFFFCLSLLQTAVAALKKKCLLQTQDKKTAEVDSFYSSNLVTLIGFISYHVFEYPFYN